MTKSLWASPNAQEMVRVVVVGCSCAGKTTFARRLAQSFAVPHVEWDVLYRDPDMVPKSSRVARALLAEAIRQERWVFDGNVHAGSRLVLSRATMVIWLNYALPLVLWRNLMRNSSKGFQQPTRRRQAATLLGRFLGRRSRPLWVMKTFHRRRKEYLSLFDSPAARHLRIIEFRKPMQAEEFLRQLEA